jgi:hypothetical protein
MLEVKGCLPNNQHCIVLKKIFHDGVYEKTLTLTMLIKCY